jgi:hypothetical protein
MQAVTAVGSSLQGDFKMQRAQLGSNFSSQPHLTPFHFKIKIEIEIEIKIVKIIKPPKS